VLGSDSIVSAPDSPPQGTDLDDELSAWLAARGFAPVRVEPLAGDVSARRYFRVWAQSGPVMLVTYPEAVRGVCSRFAVTTALLTGVGVRVPAILAADCDSGWMLCEDLGPQTLYQLDRDWPRLAPYYEDALAILARLRALPVAEVAVLSPRLDESLLAKELRQTWETFLLPRALVGDGAERARLERALGELCARLGAQAPVPCHRDFMARNLSPLGAGAVGVLDHQDLRLGPPRYDLASLLNDSLFPPPDLEERLVRSALGEQATAADRLDYHRAAAQRTLKAIGTFAAFALRGSARHLPLVGPTLRRALAHMARVPETADLVPLLAPRWETISIGRADT
jgi:aminoglycoside/choline kinase family phosphotransferase